MPRIIKAVAAALIVCVTLSMCVFAGECDEIRKSVMRLHILANSDSDEDQALKLKVRDTVLEASAGMLDTAADEGEAREQVAVRLDDIIAAAQQRVYDEGYDYEVRAELCEMYFTTRRYDAAQGEGTVTLPAGQYEALRITIGSGEGKNWWCVVFPPLCLSAAADSAQLSDVLDPEQEEIVTDGEKYEVRFKIVEIFSGLGETIKSWFR